jgi:hypothetical protein
VIVFIAAATGLVIIALQIAYLPTLYGAFNRRETEVALLARAHYALGSGTSTLNTFPGLYLRWSAGRRTWPRATPPTCRWSGSARRARSRPGCSRCWP